MKKSELISNPLPKSFFKDKSDKEVKKNPPYKYTWPKNCFDMPSLYESSDAILLIPPYLVVWSIVKRKKNHKMQNWKKICVLTVTMA